MSATLAQYHREAGNVVTMEGGAGTGGVAPSQAQLQQPTPQGLTPETEGAVRSYNPVNGSELGKMLVGLAMREAQAQYMTTVAIALPPYWPDMEHSFLRRLQKTVPSLRDELLAYVKAAVTFNVGFTLWSDRWRIEATVDVKQWPFEEKRTVKGEFHVQGGAWAIPGNPESEEYKAYFAQPSTQVAVQMAFSTDEIPPDALRVLTNQPVPTATRVKGASALEGLTSIIDTPKQPTQQERAAIEREYSHGLRGVKSFVKS